ncbi:MAG TPA: LysM peptidoglycan-binding domain-containing protein [Bacillota bacterium]|nr:LysM peptidoglycan-binding domain-containing protein [Bacillota bacterium]
MSMQCPPGTFSYRVVAGDTLYRLAQRFNTTVAAIVAANPGVNPNQLFIGQILCIPAGAQPGICSPGATTYIIQAGDTLYALAQRFGTTVAAILGANPGINPNALQIGQTICIPAPPVTSEDCAIVLTVSGAAVPALPRLPGGVVLVERINEGNYAFTFAARGLPDPSTLGTFNGYVGIVNTGGQTFLVNLTLAQAFEQESTWSGSRTLPVNPFTPTGGTVLISPFNSQTGTRGAPLLGGEIGKCCR